VRGFGQFLGDHAVDCHPNLILFPVISIRYGLTEFL